jgi:putative ABC transport system permease protein
MKYLPLSGAASGGKKVRTIFTTLSIFVAFVLFGLLMAIRTAFSFGVEVAGADRLVLIHKVSLIMPLPVSYLEAAAGHRGRRARHAQHVVRRRLPGPVRTSSRRSRSSPEPF